MLDVKEIDDKLYRSIYIDHIPYERNELWNSIRTNERVLREAVKVTKDKWGVHDTVKGLAICDSILVDYVNIDVIAYLELIKQIYSNTDIARIVVDGAANGGYSFLLMTLFNKGLKLSKEQKEFAVKEAMNKIGTTKDREERKLYSMELDSKGITDDKTTHIDIDGLVTPIGEKTKCEYFNNMFNRLSDTQAHGTGAFDIRYNILRNPNWTKEEKAKLIYDFWYDDEDYEEFLNRWEWSIINSYITIDEKNPFLDICSLYDYTYEYLLILYENAKIAKEVFDEISFCKLMHELRPCSWEKEIVEGNTLKLKSNE